MLKWLYPSLDLGFKNWGPINIHQSHNWIVMNKTRNQQRSEQWNYLPNLWCSYTKGALLLSSSPTFLLRRTKLLVIYLGWDGLSGNHWNFLKRCHNQAKLCFFLGLSGNIFLVLHLWSRLLNLSLSPPFAPLQSLLAYCFLLQGSKSLKKYQLMFFLNFKLWWRSVIYPLGNQNTNHNPRDVEMSTLSTCPSHTLCYLYLDLSIFWGVLES